MGTFRLDKRETEFREVARRYARERLAPRAQEVENAGEQFPINLLKDMADAGLLGIDIPEQYGGQGLNALSCSVILEELSAGWFSAASYSSALAVGPVIEAGSEEQKEQLLPGVCSGDIITAFALTEPSGGSDAARLETRGKRVDGGWVINGTKLFITNAHIADVIVLFAGTGASIDDRKHATVFLIDTDMQGVKIGQKFETLAHGANPIWELTFDDCFVPDSKVVGPPGQGFSYMREGFAKTRALYGARCVGVSQAAFDYASTYAQGREQFGQAISRHEGLRFKMADMATNIEAARCLAYRAATLVDDGSDDAPVAASMAKHFGADTAMSVTSDAIQIMGGHGYTRDHPLERYYREAKLFQIGDGSSEVLRLVISRDVNKRAGNGNRVALDD